MVEKKQKKEKRKKLQDSDEVDEEIIEKLKKKRNSKGAPMFSLRDYIKSYDDEIDKISEIID